MKKAIRILISNIIVGFSKLYSYKSAQKAEMFMNYFYLTWIRKEFKELGTGAGIRKPIYLAGGQYITIGNNFECDQRLRIEAIDQYLEERFFPEIKIGNNVIIQKDCHIGAIRQVVIGDNVLIASKVYISDHSHGSFNSDELKIAPVKRKLVSKGPVVIENNVWLGEGVVVLPGVVIGENSVIGAYAVVTKSVPRNSLAVGNPARVIKELV